MIIFTISEDIILEIGSKTNVRGASIYIERRMFYDGLEAEWMGGGVGGGIHSIFAFVGFPLSNFGIINNR